MRKVTVKEIAELAGTSIGTVDRAINNRGRIAPETKKRILNLAKALDYKPNRLASSLGREILYKIAVITPNKPEYFTDILIQGVKDALKEYADYGVQGDFYYTDSLSYLEQGPLVSNIDVSQYNAVMLNAGSLKLAPWINQTVEKDVLVATFNSDVEESKRLFFVGDLPYHSGTLMGEYMSHLLPQNSKVAIFSGITDNRSHDNRCKGAINALQSFRKDVECVNVEAYNDDYDVMQNLVKKLLKQMSFQAYFAPSAVGLVGAGDVLEHLPPADRPLLFGYDVNSKVADMIRRDVCTAVIAQEPYIQGYHCMKLLCELLLEKESTVERKLYLVKPQLVLKSNVFDYLDGNSGPGGFFTIENF